MVARQPYLSTQVAVAERFVADAAEKFIAVTSQGRPGGAGLARLVQGGLPGRVRVLRERLRIFWDVSEQLFCRFPGGETDRSWLEQCWFGSLLVPT